MKNVSRFKRALLISLLTWLPVCALAGGAGPGGGNLLRSTATEVNDYFITDSGRYRLQVEEVLREIKIGLMPSALLPITDSRARAILTGILAGKDYSNLDPESYNPAKFDATIQINLLSNRVCTDNGKQKDAAMLGTGKTKSDPVKICVSIPRLRHYTREALDTEVPALVIHELAHAAGYGEDDAVYIQGYIRDRLMVGCAVTVKGVRNQVTLAIQNSTYGTGNVLEVTRKVFVPGANMGYFLPENSVSYKSSSYKYFFKVSLSLSGGTLDFETMNADGSLKKQSVTFGALTYDDVFKTYYGRVNSAQLIVDGFSDIVPNVEVQKSCWNR